MHAVWCGHRLATTVGHCSPYISDAPQSISCRSRINIICRLDYVTSSSIDPHTGTLYAITPTYMCTNTHANTALNKLSSQPAESLVDSRCIPRTLVPDPATSEAQELGFGDGYRKKWHVSFGTRYYGRERDQNRRDVPI
jgi:hypothetical protein